MVPCLTRALIKDSLSRFRRAASLDPSLDEREAVRKGLLHLFDLSQDASRSVQAFARAGGCCPKTLRRLWAEGPGSRCSMSVKDPVDLSLVSRQTYLLSRGLNREAAARELKVDARTLRSAVWRQLETFCGLIDG